MVDPAVGVLVVDNDQGVAAIRKIFENQRRPAGRDVTRDNPIRFAGRHLVFSPEQPGDGLAVVMDESIGLDNQGAKRRERTPRLRTRGASRRHQHGDDDHQPIRRVKAADYQILSPGFRVGAEHGRSHGVNSQPTPAMPLRAPREPQVSMLVAPESSWQEQPSR